MFSEVDFVSVVEAVD